MSSLTLDLGNPVWISLRSAVLLLTKKEDRGVEDQVDIDWLESCVRSVGHLPLHPFRLSSDSAPSTRLNLPTHRATLFSYPILSVSSGSHSRTHQHPTSGSKNTHTHSRFFGASTPCKRLAIQLPSYRPLLSGHVWFILFLTVLKKRGYQTRWKAGSTSLFSFLPSLSEITGYMVSDNHEAMHFFSCLATRFLSSL